MHADQALFVCDWTGVTFLHFEVEAGALQPRVPFPLDRFGGRAYVSLVAFTMQRFRPAVGGRLTAWMTAPLAEYRFLNVRTYVRHGGEPGIFFLTEWVSNRLSVWLGPGSYGLPYRFGRLDFCDGPAAGRRTGRVAAADGSGSLTFATQAPAGARPAPAEPESPAEFLTERYSAFTEHHGVRRVFRVRHEPWLVTPVRAEVTDAGLLSAGGAPFPGARLAGADWSPGLTDVEMCRPVRPANPRRTGLLAASATGTGGRREGTRRGAELPN
jgi:uncharacterized protein YqjF (DUF2071 family)